MLILLTISSLAASVGYICFFSLTQFCIREIQGSQAYDNYTEELDRIRWPVLIAWFVQDTTKNAVTWLFAVKYWIIAYKVQLF